MKTTILRHFAAAHRLNTSLDECGEIIIRGRRGQIYGYGASRLGVMFFPNTYRPRQWGVHRRAATSAGMILVQNGDSEGCLVFVPEAPGHAELALKIAGVKKRRQISEARREELCGYLTKARNLPSAPL